MTGLGLALCVGMACVGGGWGIWTCGTTSCGAGYISGNLTMREIMNFILCEVIAIYGLIMSIVLSSRIPNSTNSLFYQYDQGFYTGGVVILFGGAIQGFCSFMAGLAIGVVGSTITLVCDRDPELFFRLLIVQIFSELIGIMGLLVCLLTSIKAFTET